MDFNDNKEQTEQKDYMSNDIWGETTEDTEKESEVKEESEEVSQEEVSDKKQISYADIRTEEDVDNLDEEDVLRIARKAGYKTKEEYRGDTSKLVDPKTYLKKVLTETPVLKHNLQKSHDKITDLEEKMSKFTSIMEERIKMEREQTKQKYEDELKDLKNQLAVAKDAGDIDLALETHDTINKITSKVEEFKKEESKPDFDNELIDFDKQNPILRQDPLLGREFVENLTWLETNSKGKSKRELLESALKFTKEKFPHKFNAPYGVGNVALGGTSTQFKGSKKKSYEDLPAEAKEMCDTVTTSAINAYRSKNPKGFASKEEQQKFLLKERQEYANMYFNNEDKE